MYAPPERHDDLLPRRMSRRTVLHATLGLTGAIASAVVAACGGRRTAGGDDPIVQLTPDNTFEPQHVRLIRGNTVYWVNASDRPQSVTCDPSKAKNPADAALPGTARPFDSGEMAPWSTFSVSFDVLGDYVYFSVPHESDGMVGRVTVVD